jgi:dihydroneopterin aldolase
MPNAPVHNIHIVAPSHFADARNALRHVFVRDLILDARIGVHQHEKLGPQRIRINVDLAVLEGDNAAIGDQLDNVVCYEEVVSGMRRLVAAGHLNLVETLAEQIATLCLEDRRVRVARVRVEKLDVFADATSVGVEIERVAPPA